MSKDLGVDLKNRLSSCAEAVSKYKFKMDEKENAILLGELDKLDAIELELEELYQDYVLYSMEVKSLLKI
jgi:hypothetical protein